MSRNRFIVLGVLTATLTSLSAVTPAGAWAESDQPRTQPLPATALLSPTKAFAARPSAQGAQDDRFSPASASKATAFKQQHALRQLDAQQQERVRLVVALSSRADLAATVQAATAAGGTLKHRLGQLNIASFDVPAAAAKGLAQVLAARASVVSVEVAQPRHLTYLPNDALYANEAPYLNAVAAPLAWNTAKGDASVKIAVIDSGLDVNHPDLVGKVVGAHNAVVGGVSADVTDEVGHGTFVAGVAAAASDNGVGITGVGFNSSLLAVKVAAPDGSINTDDVCDAIVWAADHGAKVINLSLGGPESSPIEANAIAYAQSRGALVVAAAGNESSSAPSYPAAYSGVLSVGATDAEGGRAGFSNFGAHVSVGAPGVSVFSTTPTAGSEIYPGTTGYDSSDGTSFSSPIVAGEAALLAAASPHATVAQLRRAIVDSAHGYETQALGAGQVDVAAALQLLPPATSATLTSPAASSTVEQTVQLAASSSAATVQFAVDGVAVGGRVTVLEGIAQQSWETFGSSGGTHDVTVADCNAFGCGAFTGVSVVVANAAPTVTSPSPASVVADVVDIQVTTTDATPKVRLLLDGQPIGEPVVVTGNAASLSWTSGSVANGAHTLTVRACSSAGACAGASTAVPVDLQNAAPAITSPTPGQGVGSAVTFTATGPVGGKLFRLDGAVIGFDATAPYSTAFDFSRTPDGNHTLTVQSCGATAATCGGLVSPGVTFSSRSLHPRFGTATPGAFSPNGDRRLDSSALSFTLPDVETVYWSVANASGTMVRNQAALGSRAAGTHSVVWNGLSSAGRRVADGVYTVTFSTSKRVGAELLRGTAKGNVRVDTVAPALTLLAPATGTLFPYPDGYRDTAAPKITLGEAGLLTLTVRNSAGATVRTVVTRHAPGRFAVIWNGRTTSGALAPAGSYKYLFTAQDSAQNRRNSALSSIPVSAAKLVGIAASRTVTPEASTTSLFGGDCSGIARHEDWAGGYHYLSNYHCSGPSTSSADVIISAHQVALPAAHKYSGIRLSVTGAETRAGHGDVGAAIYEAPSGLLGETELGSSYATRSLPAAPVSYLHGGRTLRWMVGAFEGNWYAVRSFTVRYTYYVLR